MRVFHRRMVPSLLLVASVCPSGLSDTSEICSCPANPRRYSPVRVFHRRMVPSLLLVASVCPSGLKDMLVIEDLCPVSVRRCLPVRTSHRRTVLSRLPLARVHPSGLNVMQLTASVCSVSLNRISLVCKLHKVMIWFGSLTSKPNPRPPLTATIGKEPVEVNSGVKIDHGLNDCMLPDRPVRDLRMLWV